MFVKKSIIISKKIDDIYKYILDFSQLYEWDDYVIQGERIDLGPIEVGSKFKFHYMLMGKIQILTYEIMSMQVNKYIKLSCSSEQFTAIDEIYFKKVSAHETDVEYHAKITLNNKLNELVLTPLMNYLGSRLLTKLKKVVESPEVYTLPKKPLKLVNLPYRFTSKGWNTRRKQFAQTKLSPKKILITGATSGIGRAAVFNLAGKGCELVLLGRNQEKIHDLVSKLRHHSYDQKIHSYLSDFENLEAVRNTCAEISRDHHDFDAVINNAGALFSQAKSIGGIERTTVVDLISPWMLSCHLLPQIKPHGCIINVSSGGSYGTHLNIDELIKPKAPFSGPRAYALAKRAMIVFTRGMNDELKSHGIRVHCMHPGWADTPGVIKSLPKFYKITKNFLRTPFQGADTIVWLALNNPQEGGKFWLDRQIQVEDLLSSKSGAHDDYQSLRKFLGTFSTPLIIANHPFIKDNLSVQR